MKETETGKRDFGKVLKQVQKLIQMAEAEIAATATEQERAATLQEQERARERADALMLEYAINEIQVDASRPLDERMKPGTIDLPLTGIYDLLGTLGDLANRIASHCRCRIRTYYRYDSNEKCYVSRLYGYEGDLRYAEFLYTTVRLHMLGVLRPQVDPMLSIEENCYKFHNAGFNWLEIAAFYGWRKSPAREGDQHEMWYNEKQDLRCSNWTVGSSFKRAYQRACKARGEGYTRIAAGGTETYRRSAAEGYINRIGTRLRRISEGRDPGQTQALALRQDDIDELFKSENKDLFVKVEPRPECEACKKAKSGHCRSHPAGRKMQFAPFNNAAYAAGSSYADTAELGSPTVQNTTRKIEA